MLSVVVPAFQVGRFLDEALASVVAQPIPELELVVVDDASQDETRAIAAAWCQRDRRIRLVSNPRRLGMTGTWNRGLREARGDLVFKLDGDDALEPGALADLLEQFLSHPGLRLAAFRAWECDASLEPRHPYTGEELWRRAGWGDPGEDRLAPGWSWFEGCFEDHQPWHSSALLTSRRTLEELAGWDETWGCAADTDLILRLLESNLLVLHRGRLGVRYRRHVSSVSFQAEREGWKELEAILVPLRAFARNPERVLQLPRLRWNWYRLDRGRRRCLSRCHPQDLPEERRHLLEWARRQPGPPLAVRLEGWLRDRLWQLRAQVKRQL